MDLGDLFSDATLAGADGKRGIYSRVALVFAIVGAGLGGYLGYLTGAFGPAIGWALIGAFVGWILGLAVRGFAVFLAIFAVMLVAGLAWAWVKGMFA